MVKSPRSRPVTPRLQKELVAGLEHLRSEAKEISRMYVANLQRDMIQLIDFINSPLNESPTRRRRLGSRYKLMKETLDQLNVRPEKGRRKDLRRIEQAVRSMMKLAFSKNADA